MFNDHPEIFALTFTNELLDQNVIISFEVAESKVNSFLIYCFEKSYGFIARITLLDDCEFPVLKILLCDEIVSKIAEIFKEGALHERNLIVDTWKLSYLVDELKKSGWYTNKFIVHNFEQFSEEE